MTQSNMKNTESEQNYKLRTPSMLSQLTFSYLTPLMRLARQRTLSADDLLRLLPMPVDLEPRQLATRLDHYFTVYGVDSVFRSLVMFLAPYYVVTVLTEAFASFVVAQRASLLTDYTEAYERLYTSSDTADRLSLLLMSTRIALVSMMPPLIEGFSYFRLFELAGMLRVALTGIIADRLYSATLGPLRLFDDQMLRTGKLVNILSVDVQDLQDGVVYMSPFLVMPMTVYQAALMVLGSEVFRECLAGLTVAFAYVVVQSIFVLLLRRQLSHVKACSDARIRLTHDLIRQQRSLKQLGFLQQCTQRIESLRQHEVSAIRYYLLLLTVSDCLHMLVTPLTQTVIIYTMSQNGTLTLQRMVMVKELVNIVVTRVLTYVPEIVRTVPSSFVSLGRLSEFLRVTCVGSTSARVPMLSGVVECERVRFAINDQLSTSPLTLTLERGQRCIVTGGSGAGKTTLVDGIAECLPISTGTMTLSTQATLLPQTHCIFTGTVRENIVMGRLFDRQLFERCVRECDLEDVDMERQCGVEGCALSGGQRQRVALARLVYGQPEFCVLDDPFAGLDQRCAENIMGRLFGDGGLLSRSTVIVATSCPDTLSFGYDVTVCVDRKQPITVCYERVEPPVPSTESEPTLTQRPTATTTQEPQTDQDTYKLSRVLSKYFAMSGGIIALTAILAAFAAEQWVKRQQASTILSAFSTTTTTTTDMRPYVQMSLMMAAVKIVYSVLFTLCHSAAARQLHDLFVRCLGRSGRVATRYNNKALGLASRDMYVVDVELCSSVQGLIGMVSVAAGALSVVLFAESYLLIGLMVLVWVSGGSLFYLYNQAWRQARRLLSVHNANIIDRVLESATGLAVIRSLPPAARSLLRDRLYNDIAAVGRAQQFYQSVRRWATLYLESLPITTRFVCDTVSVVLRVRPEVRVVVGEALMGNAEVFEMLSKRMSMVDSALLSFDMMLEVSEECEKSSDLYSALRLTADPTSDTAALQFNNVSVNIGNQDILKQVSFSIQQGERVAVVGRTGAGKSSLFNCIFNTLPETAIKSGNITVYNQDISRFTGIVPNLVIIPQDPCFVSASIRFNMDPLGAFTDAAISRALRRVGLTVDLDADMDAVNLSAAERQCMALARAVLNCRDGSVLLVDEVAARTDKRVLQLMTDVIMALPRTVTVVAIMHRIAGTFDRVLEMRSGELVSDTTL